jgi:hypothetical protein
MRKVPYDKYVAKKGRRPLVVHFQPDGFLVFESDDERNAWAKGLAEKYGQEVGEQSFTWGNPTYSGDADYPTHRQGDDCEVD